LIDMQAKTSLSVLVCEDELLIRIEVAEILQQLGHAVTVSATAAEAKEALAEQKYNVFVVDIELPDMSGFELAKLARLANPDIGVVFATGHAEVPEAIEVRRSVVLTKPYGQADLIRAIEQAAS
jgi:CheY-like chemotaxis protein